MAEKAEIAQLSEELQSTRSLLTALGDEVRQHLILVMMQSGDCSGLRVNDIAAKTSLSRPAVSHHLQILKSVGIVKMRREGTKNYYYFDENTETIDHLIAVLEHAKKIMSALPDRSGDD
jgi:DNA-binding transcriptional ArsR family regulator